MLFSGSSQANDWAWWRHKHPPFLPNGDSSSDRQLYSTPHWVAQDLKSSALCGLKHSLPYFYSSSLSFHRIKSAWHSEGFPCPVVPPHPFIFHSYCPPNKPLTPNSNCELLTSPSASWSLQIDTGGDYWWDTCMFLSFCLVFEKLSLESLHQEMFNIPPIVYLIQSIKGYIYKNYYFLF